MKDVLGNEVHEGDLVIETDFLPGHYINLGIVFKSKVYDEELMVRHLFYKNFDMAGVFFFDETKSLVIGHIPYRLMEHHDNATSLQCELLNFAIRHKKLEQKDIEHFIKIKDKDTRNEQNGKK